MKNKSINKEKAVLFKKGKLFSRTAFLAPFRYKNNVCAMIYVFEI